MLSAAADAASGGAVAASALFDVAPDQYVVVAEPPPPKLPVGPSVGALLAAFGGEQAQQAVHAWASAAVSTADPATLLRFPLASNHLCFDFYTEAKLYKLVNHSVYATLLNYTARQRTAMRLLWLAAGGDASPATLQRLGEEQYVVSVGSALSRTFSELNVQEEKVSRQHRKAVDYDGPKYEEAIRAKEALPTSRPWGQPFSPSAMHTAQSVRDAFGEATRTPLDEMLEWARSQEAERETG